MLSGVILEGFPLTFSPPPLTGLLETGLLEIGLELEELAAALLLAAGFEEFDFEPLDCSLSFPLVFAGVILEGFPFTFSPPPLTGLLETGLLDIGLELEELAAALLLGAGLEEVDFEPLF